MTEISFLSWNLALLERPADAPMSWTQSHTEAAVRDVVLAEKPDVVLLQELPGLVPFVETHGMVPANPKSHSGNLATLVGHDLLATKPTVSVVEGFAVLTTFAEADLTIANVHLMSGAGAQDQRLMQISKVVESAPTDRLVIVGDTNTRVEEANDLASLGLATEKPPSPTWDSRRNRFRSTGPEFSAYFTRWFAGGSVTVRDVGVHNAPTQFEGHRFHLSDHFALSGVIVAE